MGEQDTTTQVIKATQARQEWSELLNRVFRTNTRVVVEKNGIPVAALISARDLERFRRLEAQRAERFQPLLEIAQAFKDVPADEIEREVARALSEVRREARRTETSGEAQGAPAETNTSRP